MESKYSQEYIGKEIKIKKKIFTYMLYIIAVVLIGEVMSNYKVIKSCICIYIYIYIIIYIYIYIESWDFLVFSDDGILHLLYLGFHRHANMYEILAL